MGGGGDLAVAMDVLLFYNLAVILEETYLCFRSVRKNE
jgi:hypothetical protein